MRKCYKVIRSGQYVFEVYQYYEWAVRKNKSCVSGGRKKEGQSGQENRKEEYIRQVNYRAREKIRRLILANFTSRDIFLTLTFKENVSNLKMANREFKTFIQRIRRRYQSFKYVAVVEFQKRGAVHYHLICNLPKSWVDEEGRRAYSREIAEIWRNGFCDVRELFGIDNVGAYVVKYLQKNFSDKRFRGQKRYFYSRGLNQPVILDVEEKSKWLRKFGLVEGGGQGVIYPVYTSRYNGDFIGSVRYFEFNLERGGYYVCSEGFRYEG